MLKIFVALSMLTCSVMAFEGQAIEWQNVNGDTKVKVTNFTGESGQAEFNKVLALSNPVANPVTNPVASIQNNVINSYAQMGANLGAFWGGLVPGVPGIPMAAPPQINGVPQVDNSNVNQTLVNAKA